MRTKNLTFGANEKKKYKSLKSKQRHLKIIVLSSKNTVKYQDC